MKQDIIYLYTLITAYAKVVFNHHKHCNELSKSEQEEVIDKIKKIIHEVGMSPNDVQHFWCHLERYGLWGIHLGNNNDEVNIKNFNIHCEKLKSLIGKYLP